MAAHAVDADPDVRIYSFEGYPVLLRNKKSQLVKFDFLLLPEDVIKADAESDLQLTFHGFLGMYVSPKSKITIKSISESEPHVLLEHGSILASTKEMPAGTSVILETPLIIARTKVQKNLFFCNAAPNAKPTDPPGKTLFALRAGEVTITIKASNVSVNLIEGLALDIDDKSYAPIARQTTEEEVAILSTAHTVPIIEKGT